MPRNCRHFCKSVLAILRYSHFPASCADKASTVLLTRPPTAWVYSPVSSDTMLFMISRRFSPMLSGFAAAAAFLLSYSQRCRHLSRVSRIKVRVYAAYPMIHYRSRLLIAGIPPWDENSELMLLTGSPDGSALMPGYCRMFSRGAAGAADAEYRAPHDADASASAVRR